ncbi:MAG: hypothetical protein CBD57_03185 [Candidatus Pelagibacter sp. TMED197]|jgi:sulfatase maturation enzyme AslB (radical SAM superfamily)|nr:MAG: hypothetical protein CBD57_03185 [Candidatus Pelagibacter sp. TMED197]|tara:strand:- start:4032 stop:5306 length:1275 start_codon:yes stop_codon:yes gene_type:complete
MNETQKTEFEKKLKDKKIWWCPLPWTHIFSSLSGRYAPCYDALAPTGHNMENTTIKEWYTSDYQNRLREEMLKEDFDGEFFDKHCTGCRKHELLYGRSDRMKYVEQVLAGTFDSKVPELLRAVQKFQEEGKIDLDERILDIKMKMFGNACNLDCYMCTPRSANTRTISLKKIGKVFDPDLDPKDGERMNTMKHDGEEHLDDVASVAKYTRSIKLIGGEPLVMKNHYKLLDKLVQTGHSKGIDLIYKTNLSVFKMDNYDFRNYFGKFKEFVMKISIDSYGKYNDYIRKKSDWPQLIDNMMVMKARKDSRVNVHSVVSFLSVMHIWKLQEYLKEIGIPHTYYIIQHPAILQVKNLPYEIKQKLIPKYKDYPNIIKSLEKKQNKLDFVKTIEYCQALDRNHNNYKLFELYPELEQYYKEAKNETNLL